MSAASTNIEAAMEIFRLHGLSYLDGDELSTVFALVSTDCRRQSRIELRQRCQKRHPGLYAIDPEGITWGRWKRFELEEGPSRSSGSLWDLQLQDVFNDIDAMVEISQGETLVMHSTGTLTPSNDYVAECYFPFPHWSFDAPVPIPTDQFSEEDKHFPGLRSFFFWCGRFECTIQQKALIKAIYGSTSKHLEKSSPPLQVHVVFRRRSTGQMATVLSKKIPNQVIGEDYNRAVGDYSINYDTSPALDGDNDENILVCLDELQLFCSEELGEDEERVTYTTDPSIGGLSKTKKRLMRPDHAQVHFKFEGCDLNLEEEHVLKAFRSWRWA